MKVCHHNENGLTHCAPRDLDVIKKTKFSISQVSSDLLNLTIMPSDECYGTLITLLMNDDKQYWFR